MTDADGAAITIYLNTEEDAMGTAAKASAAGATGEAGSTNQMNNHLTLVNTETDAPP